MCYFPNHNPQRPTLLAKVFGCYKLIFRKTEKVKSGRVKSTSMNLLVMENLFYDKRFTKARLFNIALAVIY